MDKNSKKYKDAVEYLENAAAFHSVDYDEFIDVIKWFIEDPANAYELVQYDDETARDEWSSYVNDPEFWRNFKIVTGLDKPEQEIYPFSCSC